MTYHVSPPITDWHRQVIIGTVLGGSSIVKPAKGRNCYLFMRSKNEDWIKFKSLQLEPFASSHATTKEGNSYRWHSNCYPVFCEYRDLLYKNGAKQVSMEILDTIRPIGLMVWYADCGRTVRGKAVLNTHKLGEKSTNTICKWFNLCGYDCRAYKERGYWRVQFTPESTYSLLSGLAKLNPPSCIYDKFDG